MPELTLLHDRHAPAVLAFEVANREYFAVSVSDRGDDYFDRFTDRYQDLLAEQELGVCAFYLLVDDDGAVLGRFNLYDIDATHAVDRTPLPARGPDPARRSDPGGLPAPDRGASPARPSAPVPAGAGKRPMLGYRVAQHVSGRGVATAAVAELCGLAVTRHGLRTLRAAVAYDNIASQRVLVKTGFVPVGPAAPADLGGRAGTWYQCDL